MGFYSIPIELACASAYNLRVLFLSAEAPWGWYSYLKVDLHGIYFSYLEGPMLARFPFRYDRQMRWLAENDDSDTEVASRTPNKSIPIGKYAQDLLQNPLYQ